MAVSAAAGCGSRAARPVGLRGTAGGGKQRVGNSPLRVRPHRAFILINATPCAAAHQQSRSPLLTHIKIAQLNVVSAHT